MTVSHRLTGYDRATERLAIAYDIPLSLTTLSWNLAGVDAADEGAVGIYILHDESARRLAAAMGLVIDVDQYEWCLEPAPRPLAAAS